MGRLHWVLGPVRFIIVFVFLLRVIVLAVMGYPGASSSLTRSHPATIVEGLKHLLFVLHYLVSSRNARVA